MCRGRCKVKANVIKKNEAEKSFIAVLLLCCVFLVLVVGLLLKLL